MCWRFITNDAVMALDVIMPSVVATWNTLDGAWPPLLLAAKQLWPSGALQGMRCVLLAFDA